MKYIKFFETYSNGPKFKIGDYVRYISIYDKKNIYIIEDINTFSHIITPYYWLVDINSGENVVNWVSEYHLVKVPDYEMVAIKYNL